MSTAPLVLVAWIPLCTMLFAVFRPARAAAIAFLAGWLLLPMAEIRIAGIPDIDKVLATSVGVILGTTLFCTGRFRGYRFSGADLFLLLFLGATFVTSLVNKLGDKDGAAVMVHEMLWYGVPFLFGRALLRRKEDRLEASRIVVYAAALYALAAVYEWRMSPKLSLIFYGFFAHDWLQHARWGHWRPIVFFPHGLALGMFFAWTSILSICLWRTGKLRSVAGVPAGVIACLPVVGLATSMSLGPWGLAAMGLGLLLFWQRSHLRHVAAIPVVFALLWMTSRYTDINDGNWLVEPVSQVAPTRARSLEYRIRAETLQLELAKEQPVFGWGGWGRNRVTDAEGRDVIATDGLWIIYVATFGLTGLIAFYAWWCYPVFWGGAVGRVLERDPIMMALLIAVGLQAVNLLFNAFLSPVLTFLSGGVVTELQRLRGEARVSVAQTGWPVRRAGMPSKTNLPVSSGRRPVARDRRGFDASTGQLL